MLVDEITLRQRYDAFSDEQLLRILTAERLKYRPHALAVAEQVLARRGVSPPPEPFAPAPLPAWNGPPPAGAPAQRRPKNPYGMVDLVFDMLLFGFLAWALKKLADWALIPDVSPWGMAIYALTVFALLGSAFSLRERWRSIKWPWK